MFAFKVDAADSASHARAGCLQTPHGVVETPAFMPVGTRGSIKGVTPEQVAQTGTQIILANTYHLHVRPGADTVRALGGLHAFSGWSGPILTDSGGYQVFSLAELNTITDAGVTFRSHVDGAWLHLDAATAIEIQAKLGADIIMAFDECPALPAPRPRIEAAVERTVRWARECRDVHKRLTEKVSAGASPSPAGDSAWGAGVSPAGARDARPPQWLFGIVQGGLELDLRRRCAAELIEIGFDGYAIGGLSVGETREEMVDVLSAVAPELPADRPRYLMGVGMPWDIVQAVRCGIDMFDCVLPTRNARNAYVFTADGPLRMRNERHREAREPLEAGCDCYTCGRFSRGYLRHLFMAGEMLGPILASIHNLRFYQRLMRRIRELIRRGNLAKITQEFPVAATRPKAPLHGAAG